MWKIPFAVIAGFLIALVAFAIGREIVFAFETRPAAEVIHSALSAIGSLRWVDTTLVTGLAAVTAAALSISWIRKQIEQVERLEGDRNNAKQTAARAVLPLTLSTICDYATTCARETHDLLHACKYGRLPRHHQLPEYPEVPRDAISVIKEIVEYLPHNHRVVFAELASSMQVQRARLRGMKRDAAEGFTIKEDELLQYVVDALEVYARAAALFDYARFGDGAIPKNIEPGSIVRAIHNAAIFSRFEQKIADTAKLYEEYVLFKEAA